MRMCVRTLASLISLYSQFLHTQFLAKNFKPQVLPERISNGPLTVISVRRKSLRFLKNERTNECKFVGHEIFIAFSKFMMYKS